MTALPTAPAPVLRQVNRLRRLLAQLEELAPPEPIQFPQHTYGCGCAYCRGVVGQPGPTFEDMMAVIERWKR